MCGNDNEKRIKQEEQIETQGGGAQDYRGRRKVILGVTKKLTRKGDSTATFLLSSTHFKRRQKQSFSNEGGGAGRGATESAQSGEIWAHGEGWEAESARSKRGRLKEKAPKPPPHSSPAVFKFLSAAACVVEN